MKMNRNNLPDTIAAPNSFAIILIASVTGIGIILKGFFVKVACLMLVAWVAWLEVLDLGLETCLPFGDVKIPTEKSSSSGGTEADSEEEDGEDDDGEEEEEIEAGLEAGAQPQVQDPRFGRLRVQISGVPLLPNTPEPVPFETDVFIGRLLFMVKTQPKCPLWGDYLEASDRAFELQVQGTFKEPVTSTLYLAAELKMPMAMGLVTQTIAKAGLRFLMTMNKDLHYSFGEKGKPLTDPSLELPHMALPLHKIIDRLIVTPEGEEPPPLGKQIIEPDEAIKVRKSSAKVEAITNSIYTFAFMSGCLDWVKWQLVNMPGLNGTSISTFVGDQPLQVTVYTLGKGDPGGKHKQGDKGYILHMQLSFDAPIATKANARDSKKGKRQNKQKGKDKLAGLDGSEAAGDATSLDIEVPKGPPVRSGDALPLVAMGVVLGERDGTEAGFSCLAQGLGPAVLRQQAAPTLCQLLKVDPDGEGVSKLGQLPHTGEALQEGDTVVVRNTSLGKYLTIPSRKLAVPGVAGTGHGVVSGISSGLNSLGMHSTGLSWTPDLPTSSRGYFYITGLKEGEILTTGAVFSLGSRHRPNFQIGYSGEGSAKYGGRPLALVTMDEDHKGRRDKLKLKLVKRGPVTALSLCVLAAANYSGGKAEPKEVKPNSPIQAPTETADTPDGLDKINLVGLELPKFSSNAGPDDMGGEDLDIAYDPSLHATVPGWIEMMHRRLRIPHCAYIICAVSKGKEERPGWTCIRTGTELAPVLHDSLSTKENQELNPLKTPAGAGPRKRHRFSRRKAVVAVPLHYMKQAEHSVRTISRIVTDLAPGEEIGDVATAESLENDPEVKNSPPGSCVSTLEEALPKDEFPAEKSSLPQRLLVRLLHHKNELDQWFLRGGSAELGVVLPNKPRAVAQSSVCRCQWETHWREEWMVAYEGNISFFAPASRRPAFNINYIDVIQLETPEGTSQCPLLGFYLLKVVTLGRVSYLCFASDSTRQAWVSRINEGSSMAKNSQSDAVALGSDPFECFVLKGGPWENVGDRVPVPRLILNSRRMRFDTKEPNVELWKFSAELLRSVPPSENFDDYALMTFLDKTTFLKHLSLDALVLESKDALCFFVNLYHTLLKHAILILGAPGSAYPWRSFFLSASYEIGDDVFSLAELEYCAIRGKSKIQSLPRQWPPAPPPLDEHFRYALLATDYRINFLLNNGSLTNPSKIRLVDPVNLDEQLNEATTEYLQDSIKGDVRKRVITLPQVCDVYGDDFGGSKNPMQCLRMCLIYASKQTFEDVSGLLGQEKQPSIRFIPLKLRCHPFLQLITSTNTESS